jgi:cytochrome oxidase Cu insertion factor (SCO1/SenC/PrrC family)
MSEDIRYRQRRYLISMGIRTACLLVAIFLAGRGPVWLIAIMIAAAVVLPYVSVVFANGGREPENTPRLQSPSGPPAGQATSAPPVDADTQGTSRKQISGHHRQIGS